MGAKRLSRVKVLQAKPSRAKSSDVRTGTKSRPRTARDSAPAKANGRNGSADPSLSTRERILRAATDLFIRDGYHGVSFLDIGRELDITHSNIHYYYGNKAELAEDVLDFAADGTLKVNRRIWLASEMSLEAELSAMRDWIYLCYRRFNPEGKGGRPWGLLSRFSMDVDAITSRMKWRLRGAFRELDGYVAQAIRIAVERGELRADAPQSDLVLILTSALHLTGNLTRCAGSFDRLDSLFRVTLETMLRAYGAPGTAPINWPPPSLMGAELGS